MSRIEPWHQTNWDWRAAGNFIGGGSGTGLVILAAVASTQGLVYWPLGLVGAVLVGIGLLCVWLEIGRPWRAMHVFYHPQTSWMTREAFVSAWLLPVTILASTITLTPGTVSCEITRGRRGILIHAFSDETPEETINVIRQRYERRLKEIFQC